MAVLSKAAKETRQWFGRHRPHVAKSILYVEKLFGALDGIPGLDSIKIANLSCSAFRGVLMKWHDKVSFSVILKHHKNKLYFLFFIVIIKS